MKFRLLPVFLLTFFSFSCVPAEMPPRRERANTKHPFSGIGPGEKSVESAHFTVRAHSEKTASEYSSMAENFYTAVMNDTGLYSFMPAAPYEITVYADAEEFEKKTGSPEWSGGITYGNSILLYENNDNAGILAHEMTHLVFNEFMGYPRIQELIWINEGLAVYEECRASPRAAESYEKWIRLYVSESPIPFSQISSLYPGDERSEGKTDLMSRKWYAQVYSMVKLMMEDGGSLAFSIFLKDLKRGLDMDSAFEDAFPGKWNGLRDFEKNWKGRIGGL